LSLVLKSPNSFNPQATRGRKRRELRPILNENMPNSSAKKRRRKRVIYIPKPINSALAWDKLMKQMDKMNLSQTEKDLIKQEIQHKEAELYRLSYALTV
jgi:hypothetical protein